MYLATSSYVRTLVGEDLSQGKGELIAIKYRIYNDRISIGIINLHVNSGQPLIVLIPRNCPHCRIFLIQTRQRSHLLKNPRVFTHVRRDRLPPRFAPFNIISSESRLFYYLECYIDFDVARWGKAYIYGE